MHNTIIKAAVMGFCAGVRRAINLALKVRADFPDKRIFTLGQLIHNNEALHFLETHNIFAVSIEDIFEHTSDYSDSIIVLCAHGSEIGLLQKLESIFFKVIDGIFDRELEPNQNYPLLGRNTQFVRYADSLGFYSSGKNALVYRVIFK